MLQMQISYYLLGLFSPPPQRIHSIRKYSYWTPVRYLLLSSINFEINNNQGRCRLQRGSFTLHSLLKKELNIGLSGLAVCNTINYYLGRGSALPSIN